MTKRDPLDLLPLTPAMFYVLVALADGQTHGYAIMKEVDQLTGGAVRLSTGTLYGIVKRLLADGLVRVGVQSAVNHAETAAFIRKLMTERGMTVPPPNRVVDSICVVEICRERVWN